jgi:hypothetical protein
MLLNAKKNSSTAHSLHPKILGTYKCESATVSKHLSHDRLIPEPFSNMSHAILSFIRRASAFGNSNKSVYRDMAISFLEAL